MFDKFYINLFNIVIHYITQRREKRMENVKNVTESLLSMSDMLSELPIGAIQLRVYIKDGRLKAEKIRNKYYATRENFNDFKLRLGF